MPLEGPQTFPLDCWWQETRCLVSHGSFRIASVVRTCTGLTIISRAHDPTCHQETVQADAASVMVWGVCNWHTLEPVVRLDDSDRWCVRKHPAQSPTPTHVISAFRRTSTIPARECDTLHLESGSRYTLPTLYTSICNLNPQTWTLFSITWMFCSFLLRRDLHNFALLRICGPTALQNWWGESPLAYLQTLIEYMPCPVAPLAIASMGPTRYYTDVPFFWYLCSQYTVYLKIVTTKA